MHSSPPRRFDPPALHAALDAQRTAQGLSWAAVAEQGGVAVATINRLRHHGRFEIDGILALTSWLGQPLETFTRPGHLPPEALNPGAKSTTRPDHGPQH
ncbi:MAG TPA: cobalamin biosynthesis protein [Kribbella sp.]|uniref:cobalamin biosynthesis protein n=1 Tax=Kribbella sp. TaxID=1871183 RepID=UPI002D76F4D8|nr:cobalamin biosynthesis protein [Kribbella sp.]HET6297443.1 cobalamin biosynthesis protein [Kribbella sp.]